MRRQFNFRQRGRQIQNRAQPQTGRHHLKELVQRVEADGGQHLALIFTAYSRNKA